MSWTDYGGPNDMGPKVGQRFHSGPKTEVDRENPKFCAHGIRWRMTCTDCGREQPDVDVERREEMQRRLAKWWREKADDEVEMVAGKAVAYSSYDLTFIGRTLADFIGWEGATDREAQELGCFFYVLGKLGRMAGAYKEHRLPAPDQLTDAGVYLRMMEFTRSVGLWPTGDEK